MNKIQIFRYMGKIFYVEFQRVPLKYHTDYLTHTLKDMIFINNRNLWALGTTFCEISIKYSHGSSPKVHLKTSFAKWRPFCPGLNVLVSNHYNDVIMSAIVSQINSVSIVCSTVGSGADQRKPRSSASLAFVWGIHWWPVNSPHKGPVTRKIFPFDDVIIFSPAPTTTTAPFVCAEEERKLDATEAAAADKKFNIVPATAEDALLGSNTEFTNDGAITELRIMFVEPRKMTGKLVLQIKGGSKAEVDLFQPSAETPIDFESTFEVKARVMTSCNHRELWELFWCQLLPSLAAP